MPPRPSKVKDCCDAGGATAGVPAACLAPSGVETRQDVLLRSLKAFYKIPANIRALTDVLRAGENSTTTKKTVSLRILDWLVTNYAKERNVSYPIACPATGGSTSPAPANFNMYMQYKAQLKAYSKQFFDPFQRRERLEFKDADDRTFKSTVGQLNFFRWALVNKVVEYGVRHQDTIEAHMCAASKPRPLALASTPPPPPTKRVSTPAKAATRVKRRELSKAAIRTCTKTSMKVNVRV